MEKLAQNITSLGNGEFIFTFTDESYAYWSEWKNAEALVIPQIKLLESITKDTTFTPRWGSGAQWGGMFREIIKDSHIQLISKEVLELKLQKAIELSQ